MPFIATFHVGVAVATVMTVACAQAKQATEAPKAAETAQVPTQAAPWWQHGVAPYPLQVPADMAMHAQPIWAAPPPPPPPSPSGCTFQSGMDCNGQDMLKINGTAETMTQDECCQLCKAHNGCKVAVLAPQWRPGVNLCELKSGCALPGYMAQRVRCCLGGAAGSGACASTPSTPPQFIMARADFNVSTTKTLHSAVAFVTAGHLCAAAFVPFFPHFLGGL